MTIDPYDVLQIDRGATAGAIKAAYRRRVQSTHPDRAGTTDATEFQEVVAAFDVLSNPERKRQYDETGTVDVPDPLEDRKAAMAVLVGLFEQMVNDASRSGKRLSTFNYIAGLSNLIQRNILDAEKTLADLRRQIEERLALRKRITRIGDGPNLFADKLSDQIKALGAGEVSERQRLRILKLAETEIGNYTNEVEMIAAFQMSLHGYSAPQNTTGGA